MRKLFNDGWQFAKLHLENKNDSGLHRQPMAAKDFYAKQPSVFEPVTLPHDYLIFNSCDLYEDSVGFYRKSFTLANVKEKKYALNFEGVYMNSAVFVNGNCAGEWKYGYTSFEYDITPFVKDGENLVEVICVYQNPNTRWYSGAGIFRDVELIISNEARIVCDGIYFSAKQMSGSPQTADCCLQTTGGFPQTTDDSPQTTSGFPQVVSYSTQTVSVFSQTANDWQIKIQTEISGNYKDCSVKHTIFPYHDNTENALKLYEEKHESKEIKTLQPPMGTSFNSEEKILLETTTAVIKNPALWDTECPTVYNLQTIIVKDGKTIDRYSQQIGFRTIEFDSSKGLFVNGKNIKIKGSCEHHDLGALGSAFNIVAVKRKFLRLKEMGVNAIRTSHNPQTKEFLNLADRMGLLVCDECFDIWEKNKTQFDYANYFNEWHERDTSSWVRKDRNHPCVFMWSIGNEIYDTHQGNGYQITKDLCRIVRRHDPQKNAATTIGSNYMEWDGAQKCAEEIDVAGYNYGERLYQKHHAEHPKWCIYGSETSSTVQSRSIYHFPLSNRLLTYQDQQCSSLGNCSTNWGAVNSSWNIFKDRDAPFCAGQFIWTGWDYIGEPTPYFSKNSFFGQIDTAGFRKDTFYVYKAAWTSYKKQPFVHILPYWDFNNGQLIDVRVNTNAPAVELFFNGKSLGKKEIDFAKGTVFACDWQLEYKYGTLTAIAYDENNNEIAREEQKSFGESKNIILEVEKESEDNLYFIDISTTDQNNIPVANARNRMFVQVTGNARIEGIDNGDSTDWEQYKSKDGIHITKKLFNNALMLIVKSSGIKKDFSITVNSPGLNGAELLFANGKIISNPAESTAILNKDLFGELISEIPVRKIELECKKTTPVSPNNISPQSNITPQDNIIPQINAALQNNIIITPQNNCIEVTAKIHPVTASYKNIIWKPMLLEGVSCDCALIEVIKPLDETGCETVRVKGHSDGTFRLTCTASNGKDHPEIISELEFSVKGFGKAAKNPYQLIEACKCSSSFKPVKLSFDGGVFTEETRSWFSFANLDFGKEGSDTIELPIFSFSNEVSVEVWEGNPDKDGQLLQICNYKAQSWYNHYQSNTFVLPKRLFGIHEITILFNNRMSLHGIKFIESKKAFSRLNALDASLISGDSFVKEKDCVSRIGNNVAFEYTDMNFGSQKITSITICGFAHVDNTIHILFSDENCTVNRVVEFSRNDSFEEKTFAIEELSGNKKVTLLFLPGSDFDLKYFQFHE